MSRFLQKVKKKINTGKANTFASKPLSWPNDYSRYTTANQKYQYLECSPKHTRLNLAETLSQVAKNINLWINWLYDNAYGKAQRGKKKSMYSSSWPLRDQLLYRVDADFTKWNSRTIQGHFKDFLRNFKDNKKLYIIENLYQKPGKLEKNKFWWGMAWN